MNDVAGSAEPIFKNSFKKIIDDFKQVAPKVDYWSLRLVFDQEESLSVRQNVVQPPHLSQSKGAHLTIVQTMDLDVMTTFFDFF